MIVMNITATKTTLTESRGLRKSGQRVVTTAQGGAGS
jgi:hypothetical protein